jgi:alkanesulfonate monooxygenase SsuD/methylene tetrahydromethanopterin reductase-like flavin-dependent oxidoreductase (luciferase family)
MGTEPALTEAEPTRELSVGLVLPQFWRATDGQTVRWSDLRAMAQCAETVGFDSVWTFDELLWPAGDAEPIGFWEDWSLLAALAEATSRVRVGSLITCANYRNPALLARMAETVDEVSDGRLVLGLGAGWSDDEFAGLGIPFEHRLGRFEEALAIIHAMLRAGRVAYEGRYHRARLESTPRGPRPNQIPILVGGTGPGTMALAARYADEWNAWIPNRSRPSEVTTLRAAVDAACRAVGRDPDSLRRSVGIAVGLGDAELRIGPVDWTAGAIRGSVEDIASSLRAFADEGIAEVQIVLAPFEVHSIEAFGPVIEALAGKDGVARGPGDLTRSRSESADA